MIDLFKWLEEGFNCQKQINIQAFSLNTNFRDHWRRISQLITTNRVQIWDENANSTSSDEQGESKKVKLNSLELLQADDIDKKLKKIKGFCDKMATI